MSSVSSRFGFGVSACSWRRRVADALVATVVACSVVALVPAAAAQTHSADSDPIEIVRYGGADRYATSLLVAEVFAADSGGRLDRVVMVSGRHWYDAVVAAAYAGHVDAPVLMTPPDGVRDDALEFLKRVGVSHVTVVTTGAWPDTTVALNVFATLDKAGFEVGRLGGDDRFGTGRSVAEWMVAAQSQLVSGKIAIIANGEVFADALVAGPLSAKRLIPVLLSPKEELHPVVREFLSDAGIERVVLMGGTAALSESVEAAVAGMGISVDRMAGATRFETATLTGEFAAAYVGGGCFAGTQVGLARARVPFDSFSAAPLMARRCAPLVLTSPAEIPAATVEFIEGIRRGRSRITLNVFGGSAAVSQGAIEAFVDSATSAVWFTSVSAGGHHSCGVRNDGTVACWGDDVFGQSSPPPGEFLSVSAGREHSCGVGANGWVICWGKDSAGESSPPSGKFASVSAGSYSSPLRPSVSSHSCGVRIDGTVACWGDDRRGKATPPSGKFVEVSAGGSHTCGIRTDSTLACWGFSSYAKAPAGTFSSVSAGSDHTCGIRTDSTLECWGSKSLRKLSSLSGEFASVSAGRYHTCGVRTNGTVACWGWNPSGQTSAPSGEFASVSSGGNHTCGVRTGGTIGCWPSGEVPWTPPSDEFATVSAGPGNACGVRTDGTIGCWGDNDHGESTPPTGTFSWVSTWGSETCGVRTDGTLACWGANRFARATPPSGTYVSVSVGASPCAIRTDGTVACWGPGGAAPTGTFMSVSSGAGFACGVRAGGTIACWGQNSSSTSTPVSGTFSSVSAGYGHTCGLRTSGSIVCWGLGPYDRELMPPSGTFESVSVGGAGRACGLRTNGTVACWSDIAGDQRAKSVPPTGTFKSVSLRGLACGVRTDDTVACWPWYGNGQTPPP